MALSAELPNLFKEKHKSTCCKTLTKNMELGSKEHMDQCIYFTGGSCRRNCKTYCK